jgi:hypothetical protein
MNRNFSGERLIKFGLVILKDNVITGAVARSTFIESVGSVSGEALLCFFFSILKDLELCTDSERDEAFEYSDIISYYRRPDDAE